MTTEGICITFKGPDMELFHRKGFHLSVTTWENDGDNYKVKTIDGLSQEDLVFFIELAKQFHTPHGIKVDKKLANFGNSDRSEEELQALLNKIVAKHPNISEYLKKESEYSEEIYEFFYMFLGFPVEYEYGFCRVVESIKVAYFPVDVYVEDLTDRFV